MEDWEQGFITMPDRLAELASLREAWLARNEKPSLQWMTEAITAISTLLSETENTADKIELLATLALAMWQAGYEAAPKLEFVLPEGAGG